MKNTEFITGSVPITKEEVRAVSLSKLELFKASSFLDVGAGTGSISIEAAVSFPNLRVFSLEKEEKACELIEKNIEKFGIRNIELIKMNAPDDGGRFDKMEFDSIFLGGFSNNAEEVVEWSHQKLSEGGRLVANFILLGNFYKCLDIIESVGFKTVEVSQIGISKLEKLGRGSFFKPMNPIFVISASK